MRTGTRNILKIDLKIETIFRNAGARMRALFFHYFHCPPGFSICPLIFPANPAGKSTGRYLLCVLGEILVACLRGMFQGILLTGQALLANEAA